ncbi:hypothetical protein SPRG_02372 [Saprolegnia parasitica CBS 223.65]|uniref:Niemann-Pick C1 N-terminal domain-containing protein n=1 Tax=Saprolegnia parasitica (strain CBS 223.65) TaxID=695850 RepID=A0A067D0Z9_SAPPC|nr:hypothetical protein SPRG_02372 [Saprolegnia parasitica CBS 223.65]KDO32672.1 hypothetical protein SPRG_02372 [Saprolegnia parasitica CBS 223.65]|eukprot:XP_012196338.1 hypothetical protein SPRG_02372 [Saprolegnia parasitica CBS 223.65]
MRGTLPALALIWLSLGYVDGSGCVMTQDCVNPGNIPDYDACIPKALASVAPPMPMRGDGWATVTGGGTCKADTDCHQGTCVKKACVCRNDGVTAGAHCDDFAIQCPEYESSACCSWQQNRALADNFKLIATMFGRNSAGGCDACAANMMRMWCGLVCAPNQADFMKMHLPYPSNNYRLDSMTGKDHVKVLEMDVNLAKPFTCALFDSCKHTAIASMSDAFKSSLGFLNYQGQTGAVGHGEYLFFHFGANSSYFNTSALRCDNYSEVTAPDVYHRLPAQAQRLPSMANPLAPKQCPCGACRATCSADSGASAHIMLRDNPIGFWTGFNVQLVSVVYAGIALLTGALYWKHRLV